jgi:hypothetical protein
MHAEAPDLHEISSKSYIKLPDGGVGVNPGTRQVGKNIGLRVTRHLLEIAFMMVGAG